MKRVSQILIPTLKLQQQESLERATSKNVKKAFQLAETVRTESSHELLIRAGFLRQSSSGLFTLLPYGALVLKKIEKLIDEEMYRIGGQKVFTKSVRALGTAYVSTLHLLLSSMEM